MLIVETIKKEFDVNTDTMMVSSEEIDCVMLRTDPTEPGITYWLSDRRYLVQVLGDDAECDATWEALLLQLRDRGFVRYHGLFFRATQLVTLEQQHPHDALPYLQLFFSCGVKYRQPYEDEELMQEEHALLTDILSELQIMQAAAEVPKTIQ